MQSLRQRQHVLDLDDFSHAEMDEILDTADSMREVLSRDVKQVPALRDRIVATLFGVPCDLTHSSFETAAHALSARVIALPGDNHATHGHMLVDTVRMIESLGADILVLRHAQAGAPYLVQQHFDGAIINAGDGAHANPAQALLNLFIIRDKRGGVQDARVVLVGDVLHNDSVRSTLWGLTRMGAHVTLCAPPPLIGAAESWLTIWPGIHISHNLDESIEAADVVLPISVSPTSVDSGLLPPDHEYRRYFALTSKRLERTARHALIIPPVPLDASIACAPEVALSLQPLIREYITGGVAVRMALLYHLAA